MEPYDIREPFTDFERSVIIDNIKALLLLILGVLLLLSVCVSIDYADDTITSEQIEPNVTNCTLINGVHYDNVLVNNSKSQIKSYKVVTVKPKYPTITITARPSVRSGYAYRWYTTTWINYCPHCHRYGVLYNAHKYQARHEQELTCHRCGADYCGVVGKEKYSWSRTYLRRA